MDGSTIKVDHRIELGIETIAERGAQVGEVFKDLSLSAWNPRVVRDDRVKLMERVESGVSERVSRAGLGPKPVAFLEPVVGV